MAEINSENIKSLFCRITGEEEENFKYGDLLSTAQEHIRELLVKKTTDGTVAARCEYAAAAQAVYDYTLEKMLCDRVMLTESGGAYSGTKGEEAVRAALEFKNSALAALKGEIEDSGFVFSTACGFDSGKPLKGAEKTERNN